MQILQLLTFRTSRDETDGLVFDRILKVLTERGYNPEKIRFRFEDRPQSPFVKNVSAVARAVNAYPELGSFRGEIIQQWNNNQQLVVLSNFHTWSLRPEMRTPPALATPASSSTLSGVLHGIPRRFPFWHARILFDDVAALNAPGRVTNENETLAGNDLTGPGVILESSSWTSGRTRELEAVVAVPVPENNGALRLTSAAEDLIAHVGKVTHIQLKIAPAATEGGEIEAKRAQAKLVTEKYKQDPFAALPGTMLPHPLPRPAEALGVPLIARREEGIPSVKELLKQEFQPTGYRYKSALSGQGCYTLRKKGAYNYVFGVFVDVSPIAGQFCASFGVSTPLGSFSVPVQLPPFGRDYPVNEHLPAVVKNTAFVVQKLESTYAAELALVLGAAPAWFADASLSK